MDNIISNELSFTSITERNVQILQMAMEHPYQLDKIANAFTLSLYRTREILNDLGFMYKNRMRHRDNLVMADLQSGMDTETLCNKYCFGKRQLWVIARDNGYSLQVESIKIKKIKAKQLKDLGYSHNEIAKKLNVTKGTIINWIGRKCSMVSCDYCGNSFIQNQPTHRFCLWRCQRLSAASKKNTRSCVECGIMFEFTGRPDRRKFCLPFCRYLHRSRNIYSRKIVIQKAYKSGISKKDLCFKFNLSLSRIEAILRTPIKNFPPIGWAVNRPIAGITSRGKVLIRQIILKTRREYQEWQMNNISTVKTLLHQESNVNTN